MILRYHQRQLELLATAALGVVLAVQSRSPDVAPGAPGHASPRDAGMRVGAAADAIGPVDAGSERAVPIELSDRLGDTLSEQRAILFDHMQRALELAPEQLNAVKISGVPTVPLNEALEVMERAAAEILPRGYVIDYTGESRQLRQEGSTTFLVTFVLALALIFLVLAAQFNSFRDPLVILLGSVPLAMFGALLFTFLKMPAPDVPFFTDGWTTTLNIYSQVGLVTLVGLVSKNGILIVEFANQLQRAGKAKVEAIHEAAMTRLRPILMTSAATVFGHFPLVLVSGAGAEARNSIGIIIVAGMAVGTLLTLLVIPSLYMLIARDHSRDPVTEAIQSETV